MSYLRFLLLCGACAGLALAAHARDYLVGPVALGASDALAVSVANLKGEGCGESVEVAFLEHAPAGRVDGPRDAERLPVQTLGVERRGAAMLQPGESTTVRVRGDLLGNPRTLQAAVRKRGLDLKADPCIAIAATVFRANGQIETIGGAQFSDDFSVLRPLAEATCLGSSDCDDLISLCEQQGDECSFTCHIAIPNDEGQACVFGSTDD